MTARRLNLALAALLAALAVASLLLGPAGIGPGQAFAALFGQGEEALTAIMREVRLPRTVLAALIGFSLGLAGAVLQGYLRNPLAEPGLIGVSAMGSLGAVVAFYSGVFGVAAWAAPAGALAGSALAVVLLVALAAGSATSLTLILAGVALSSLAGALTSLVLNLSPNPFASYEIIFWLMGSLKDRSTTDLAVAGALMLPGWLLLLGTGRALDALTFGEETAESLGVDLRRTTWMVIGGVALATAGGTAVAGAIGFVGLVVPHLMRPFTDRLPGSLLWPSGLGGAALLLASDIGARVALDGRELNVGVVTALIGAPFFFWLVLRTRSEAFA